MEMCDVVFIAETTDIPFRQASLEIWVHLLEVTANIPVCQSMSHKILNNFGNRIHCSLSRFSMHIEVAMDYGGVAMEISTLAITSFGGFLSLDLHIDTVLCRLVVQR